MVKTINIGAEAVEFKSSAALPIVYRETTGREFFTDLQSMESNVSVAMDMAYTMHKHADPNCESKDEWLGRFELMDLSNAMPQLVAMLTHETKTASTAKKNNAR